MTFVFIMFPFNINYTLYKYSKLATMVDVLVNSLIISAMLGFCIALFSTGFFATILTWIFGPKTPIHDAFYHIALIFIIVFPIACRVFGRKFDWSKKVNDHRIKWKIKHSDRFAKRFYAENPQSWYFILSLRPGFTP